MDLTVLNAGYAYDVQVLRRWFARTPGAEGRLVSPTDLTTELAELEGAEADRFAPLLDVAVTVLDRAQCRPAIRSFTPARLASVLLGSRDARRQQDRATVLETTSGPWAAALQARDRPDDRPSFVLNAANASVRRLAEVDDLDVQRAAVEALYAQALFAGRHPLRPFDSALVARALPTLIELAIGKAAP
jgi:molecular chaperone HtpG